MNNNKEPLPDKTRLFLAIILSVGVMAVWIFYQNRQVKTARIPPPVQLSKPSEEFTQKGIPAPPNTNTINLQMTRQSTQISAPQSLHPEHIKSTLIFLENENLKIVISTKNACIVTNIIKTNLYNNIPDVDLEKHSYPEYTSGRILFYEINTLSENNVYYNIISSNNSSVTLLSCNEQYPAVPVSKFYYLSNYTLFLTVHFPGLENQIKYILLNGSGMGKKLTLEPDKTDVTYVSYTTKEKNHYKNGLFSQSLFSKNKNLLIHSEQTDWLAHDNRYFVKILHPLRPAEAAHFYRHTAADSAFLLSGYQYTAQNNTQYQFKFSFLPKSRRLFSEFWTAEKVQYFLIFRQSSLFHWLANTMYTIIMFFNKYMSMGISIILMTFLIKLITFPLHQSSMSSMKKMQALAPKIEEIKIKHKNDPKKLNEETMGLYKKHKINPLGGCLPMLLPIPIFFALYSLFQNMIELNGKSYLWIADLALPDTIATLPFSVPILGNDLNILPIIMTLATILQSMFTPQGTTAQNSQQAVMMKYLFPIMFLFICWNMPSGLVLYWTAQAFFTFVHSFIMVKIKK